MESDNWLACRWAVAKTAEEGDRNRSAKLCRNVAPSVMRSAAVRCCPVIVSGSIVPMNSNKGIASGRVKGWRVSIGWNGGACLCGARAGSVAGFLGGGVRSGGFGFVTALGGFAGGLAVRCCRSCWGVMECPRSSTENAPENILTQ